MLADSLLCPHRLPQDTRTLLLSSKPWAQSGLCGCGEGGMGLVPWMLHLRPSQRFFSQTRICTSTSLPTLGEKAGFYLSRLQPLLAILLVHASDFPELRCKVLREELRYRKVHCWKSLQQSATFQTPPACRNPHLKPHLTLTCH